MLVRELISQLNDMEPEAEVVVVLFAVDGSSSQFVIDGVEAEESAVRIEASES